MCQNLLDPPCSPDLALYDFLLFLKLWRYNHHHHHLPWIKSFDLFQHRRSALISYGVHDLFFLEVYIWGCVLGVWHCPFFQDGWSSFVCIWISRLVFQRSLVNWRYNITIIQTKSQNIFAAFQTLNFMKCLEWWCDFCADCVNPTELLCM